ncbi:MAG: guanylate kinase, partial [Bradymonadaceae bacterium]
MDQGVLLIVCGPSGVGKTSLCDALLAARPRLTLSVSYTTREPRGREEDGVDY